VLDIDPSGGADIVCDARELVHQKAAQFDAVYCSHNLEHYYHHEVPRVLAGFLRILKPNGFAEIRVPDLIAAMKRMLSKGMDIEDELYVSAAGPISVRDMIYGSARLIERGGSDFMAHRTGFTERSLGDKLHQAGFQEIWLVPGPYEICAFAFKNPATPQQLQQLKLALTTEPG
jgi:SAM-dependent methyltransferase